MYKNVHLSSTRLPTNLKFGRFFSALFCVLAVYAYWKSWGILASAALVLSLAFIAFTVLDPQRLDRLNRLWYRFGLAIGGVVSPVVLGAIFFLIITPTAMVLKLRGRDELRIKKRSVESYWVDRSPAGPAPESF